MKNVRCQFVLFILSLLLFACEKDSNDYGFDQINSSSDWNLDDKFNQREMNLFSELDFNKTAEFVNKESGTILFTPQIIFTPNPFQTVGYLSYNTAPIINIVIVNKDFRKIQESRFENSYEIGISLADEPSGIYRIYYVIQDEENNIVQLGHGNIKKE
jgi:hypothetical protein